MKKWSENTELRNILEEFCITLSTKEHLEIKVEFPPTLSAIAE